MHLHRCLYLHLRLHVDRHLKRGVSYVPIAVVDGVHLLIKLLNLVLAGLHFSHPAKAHLHWHASELGSLHPHLAHGHGVLVRDHLHLRKLVAYLIHLIVVLLILLVLKLGGLRPRLLVL
jgi:hypothetical protein